MEPRRGAEGKNKRGSLAVLEHCFNSVYSWVLGLSGVLSQQKLQELVSEIDPKQVLDEDVEEVRL